MNTTPPLLLATVVTITGLAPALCADLSKLPPAATQPGLTFAKDIRPLFEASCFNCHGERRQRAGLRLDSLEAVLQGSDEIKVVIPGRGAESPLVLAVAQLDEETAMPPRRQRGGFGGGPGGPPGGGREPGGPGARGGQGGAGRPGPGRGGGGMGAFLASPLFSQADGDGNKKLSSAEFTQLADAWFDALDTAKSGKLTLAQFTERLDSVLPSAPPRQGERSGGGRGPGGQRGGNDGMGFGPGRFIGGGIFSAADTDKDTSLTRAELKSTFTHWYGDWDTEKSDALSEEQFREGLTAALMRLGGGGRGLGGPGPGGFGGGFAMFGRQALAQQMVLQGDTDQNGKLSKAEFIALAETWFLKLDPKKSGQVDLETFTAKLADALGLPQSDQNPEPTPDRPARGRPNDSDRPEAPAPGVGPGPGGRGPGGPRGLGGPAAIAPGLFAAADGDKNGTLSRLELQATFTRWSNEFDSEKAGALDADQLYAGLREALPQGAMGGFGGFGGGGPGDQGPAPKALTREQVGLVRAWIDQGAK